MSKNYMPQLLGKDDGYDLGMKFTIILTLVMMSTVAFGKECKNLRYNGTLENKLNLVLVPSGFDDDMALFEKKAKWIEGILETHKVLDSKVTELNIMLSTKKSGSICEFNCKKIDRLLCCDYKKATLAAAECVKKNSKILVVHNSEKYGGSGGRISATSINSNSPNLVVHELGHSLFGLVDEYDFEHASDKGFRNCQETGCEAWKDMDGMFGISCLPGHCADGKQYVGKTSIMEFLHLPFEAVNERFACCAYKKETGTFPSYCKVYQETPGLTNLTTYCTEQGYLTKVTQPVEATLTKNDQGEWKLSNFTSLREGFFSKQELMGDKNGEIEVEIGSKLLRFSEFETLEYPASDNYDEIGGVTRVKRNLIKVIFDNSKAKQSSFIKVNNKILN